MPMTSLWRFYFEAEALRVLRAARHAAGLNGPDTPAEQVKAMGDDQIAEVVRLAHRRWDDRHRRYFVDYAWLSEAQRRHMAPAL